MGTDLIGLTHRATLRFGWTWYAKRTNGYIHNGGGRLFPPSAFFCQRKNNYATIRLVFRRVQGMMKVEKDYRGIFRLIPEV